MEMKRYDKKINKKELWKLEDKMNRLRYLFTMYGFKVKTVYNFRYSTPKIIFEETQETIELFENLQKELKKSKDNVSLCSHLTILLYQYDTKAKETLKSYYYGYDGTYYSCKSWLGTDILRLEKLLKIK